MINILLGLTGSGKTYVLSRYVVDFLRQGRQIYSNYHFNLEHPFLKNHIKQIHYWETVDDLIKLDSGIIVMDEAQVYFNSRAWANADIRLQYKLQQHRKDGLDIWGTCQNEKRLDTVMRELVGCYYMCHKFIGSKEGAKRVWGLIRCSLYYPEEVSKTAPNKIFSHYYFIRREYVDLYDTNMKIALEDTPRNWKHQEYYCKKCDKIHISHIQQ